MCSKIIICLNEREVLNIVLKFVTRRVLQVHLFILKPSLPGANPKKKVSLEIKSLKFLDGALIQLKFQLGAKTLLVHCIY